LSFSISLDCVETPVGFLAVWDREGGGGREELGLSAGEPKTDTLAVFISLASLSV